MCAKRSQCSHWHGIFRGTNMGFEVFHRGSFPPPNAPSVTIQKKGLFSLNRAAMQLLHDPEAVQFLWDRDRRVVGLQAVSIESSNAYPVRPQGSQARIAKGQGGASLIAGTLFTRFIELDTSQARRWMPRMEGDILIVDLKQVGQPITSNRDRRRLAEAPAERQSASHTDIHMAHLPKQT